jgi:hypothetical protein
LSTDFLLTERGLNEDFLTSVCEHCEILGWFAPDPWYSAVGFRNNFHGFYLHSALKIQNQMLVVNDSAICRGRMGSGLLSPYTSEHLTLAGEMKQYRSPRLVILDELS